MFLLLSYNKDLDCFVNAPIINYSNYIIKFLNKKLRRNSKLIQLMVTICIRIHMNKLTI